MQKILDAGPIDRFGPRANETLSGFRAQLNSGKYGYFWFDQLTPALQSQFKAFENALPTDYYLMDKDLQKRIVDHLKKLESGTQAKLEATRTKSGSNYCLILTALCVASMFAYYCMNKDLSSNT